MSPARSTRSAFTAITEGTYWFLAIDVLLVLACAPTIVVWALLGGDPAGALWLGLSALPVLPALAASLYAWRKRSEDPDLSPASHFLRGYRLNLRDSLAVGAPALAILTVLALNITYGGALGTASFSAAFLVIGALVLLILVRALTIVSSFSFRLRDVLRLSVFTLLTKPLTTLALLSLGVLTVGLMHFVGEFALLIAASLLSYALWTSEQPVARLLRERFVRSEDSPAPGPAA